nr:DUF5312 domain-containing protein [Treponema paraluiscuniculi]
MNEQLSTFDKLVETLSTEDAQRMLADIGKALRTSEANAETPAKVKKKRAFARWDTREDSLAGETFFFRFWIGVKSFFRSSSVEALYEETLLQRLGNDLKAHYAQYIDVKEKTFTKVFYDKMGELRKTQVFFDSLLACYNSDKGDFYLLLSSFITPVAYEQLMACSDPFAAQGDGTPSGLRASLLKRMDVALATLSGPHKTELYQAARAIEWMKVFCEVPVDRILLRFTVISPASAVCPITILQSELEKLACVIHDSKHIPDAVLQGLFVLKSKTSLHDAQVDNAAHAAAFLKEASAALVVIKDLSHSIPIEDFVRFAGRNIRWQPRAIAGGEDWFVHFKNAWKKRFNEKWALWSTAQKRLVLKEQMLSLLGREQFSELTHRPWEGFWYQLVFRREMSFVFLKNLFEDAYARVVSPPLNVILAEGSFYRRDELIEYTDAVNVLEQMGAKIRNFEVRLSPVGEWGVAFSAQRKEHTVTMKSKGILEALIKVIDSEATVLLDATLKAFHCIGAMLASMIGASKTSAYATLTNWSDIRGSDNASFREQASQARAYVQTASRALVEMENLETTHL